MKIRRSLFPRVLAQTLLVGAAGFVASACSPVGGGIGPIRLVVNGPTGVADQPSARVFECLRNGLSATLFFSDGTAGDFSNRVRWTSSNPAVIRVSNGDEPAPAPAVGFFPYGTLTPVAPGTATITANYLGYSDTIQISVGTPTNIAVHTVNPQNGFRVDPAGNAFRIGAGTVQDLTVTGSLDNVESTLDNAVLWSFDAPNDAVATIAADSGLITGVAAGGPLVARARFAPCALTASTTVSVAPVQAIAVVPEYSTSNLIVGTSEIFSVLADFGNGPEQDISQVSVLTSSNTAAGAFALSTGLNNLLFGVAAGGPYNVGATFTVGTTVLTAPTVAVSTIAGTLQTISVTPASATVVAGSNQVVQYNVLGDYGNGLTQDITRLASWVSSDNTIGQVSSSALSAQLAGQALSFGPTPGTVTFTATVPITSTTVATATAGFTTTAPPPI